MSTSPENERKYRADPLKFLANHRKWQWEFRDKITLAPRDNPALRIAIERGVFGWPTQIPPMIARDVHEEMRWLRFQFMTLWCHRSFTDDELWDRWLAPFRKMGLDVTPNFAALDDLYREAEKLAGGGE